MDTTGSNFDTLLAVYTGSSVSSLTVVTNNDDIAGATNRFSRVTFTPVAGTTYHIAVDGYGGAFGMMMLNWNQACAALPDLIFWGPAASPAITTQTFASTDCEVVEGCESTGTHTLLTFNAETRNIGSGDLVIGDPSTNVLFHYASCHGHYHFEDFAQYSLLDTNGNTVATGHKVGFCVTDNRRWSPTANQSAVFNCNYQGLQAGWADVYKANLPCQYVDITGVPDGSYVLRMALNPAGPIAESDTNNNVTLVPITIGPQPACTPANDNFANAISVTATPFSTSLSTDCATREAGEPNHAADIGGHSIWYKWTPSVNQTAVITTKGSNFDTLLAVYTGNSVSSLALVANNDDIIFGVYLQSYVSFAANAGTTYRIAVDGYQGAVGTVILNLNPAGNDDFANANVISGTSGTTNGFTIAASKEPYEPAHAGDVGGRSVEFNTAGSSFDTVLAVYTGNNVTSLTAIAGNDDDVGGVVTSRLGFSAVAGTTYRIAVDGAGGASGNDILNWNMMSRLGIARLPGRQAQVSFTGVNWQRYALESSSNFTIWSTQATRTMSGGSQQYLESSAPGRRFYRTVRMP